MVKRVPLGLSWPQDKTFAFTIIDDTDLQTVENTKPVYDFLGSLGFRITKTVWPISGERTPDVGGMTCQNADYRDWVLELQETGFEIALHNVTYHTSNRLQTIRGMKRFKDLFCHYPKCHANHTGCRESIYWGSDRLSGIRRALYNIATGLQRHDYFRGHCRESDLFWGDICSRRIKYVRNFVYGDINTLKACPVMPYHDNRRPFVNYWFAASEGPNVDAFVETVDEEAQDRLEAEGGACIMYAHLASRFYQDGSIDSRFRQLMERLSRKDGWFVPVSTLLDYILKVRGPISIGREYRSTLEWKWLCHKATVGGTS